MAYCSAMCEVAAEGITIEDLLRAQRAGLGERVAVDVEVAVALGAVTLLAEAVH